jgi:Carboxypeptidase regulatory-like domain
VAGVERSSEAGPGADDGLGAAWMRLVGLLGAICLLLTLALASASAANAETGIAGRVSDAVTKAPIAGIEVCAFDLEAQPLSEGLPGLACAITGASGEYVIDDLRNGEYEVEFSSPEQGGLNYVTQYYDGKASFGEATPVLVVAGRTTSEIDAEMREGGKINGEVTDASNGAHIGNVEVCAFSLTAASFRCAPSEPSGKYTITALATGEYYVSFSAFFAGNYVPQYYDGASSLRGATTVSVTATSTTSEIDAKLVPGASISGRVTSAATGAPIKRARVCALVSFTELEENCVFTTASGEYKISELAAGAYAVKFDAEPNFPIQYYNDKLSFSTAERVTLAAGATASGINAALGPPAPAPPAPPVPEKTVAKGGPEIVVDASPPTAASVLSLTGSNVSVRGREASLKVVCAGAKPCRGRLTLSASHLVKIDGKRRTRTVAIGAATVKLTAGATAAVKIGLNPVGRALLAAARGRLHARLSVLQVEPTPSKTRASTVLLKLVEPRGHAGGH